MIDINSYRIFKKLNLIVQYFQGKVSISIAKEHMKQMSSDPDYSQNYDTIVDLRSTILDPKVDNVNKFADYISNELNIIGKRKVVYLTSKPNQVVLTTLLSKALYKSEIVFFTCSTKEAAIKFLNKNELTKEILETLIKEMKTQPNRVDCPVEQSSQP